MTSPREHLSSLSPAFAPGEIPRWDDAPLAQEIFLLANLMQRVGDKLVAHHNLTSSRWLLLCALEHFEQAPSITELAGDGLMTVQNVSRLVASMERDNLVERFTVQGKGRQVFIRLTPLGERVNAESKEQARQFTRAFLQTLSPNDVHDTQNTLDTLIRNILKLDHQLDHAHPTETARTNTP